MICPNCSSKALCLIAWPGGVHRSCHEPNVFSQYRCLQETLLRDPKCLQWDPTLANINNRENYNVYELEKEIICLLTI
jgi:hypothetical protein